MGMKKIKQIVESLNEATLQQTLSNFNMDNFVDYYIKTIKEEYEGELPEQLYEYVAEEMEDNDEYLQEFEQELGFPYEDMEHDADNRDDNYYKFESSRLFKRIIKNYLENALNATVPNLRKLASQARIPIYRLMRFGHKTQSFVKSPIVSPNETYVDYLAKYGGRLGIYWTETKDAIAVIADSTTGEEDLDNYYYLLETDIDNKYINWYDTLYQRVHIEYGDWQEWKPEQEIRLYKNTPLKLAGIGRYNPSTDEFEPQDMSKIKNKTFRA